jgi:hypothetical protein
VDRRLTSTPIQSKLFRLVPVDIYLFLFSSHVSPGRHLSLLVFSGFRILPCTGASGGLRWIWLNQRKKKNSTQFQHHRVRLAAVNLQLCSSQHRTVKTRTRTIGEFYIQTFPIVFLPFKYNKLLGVVCK